MPIADLKEGEMVGKVREERKTRNGQPNDLLMVKFIISTFVHVYVNVDRKGLHSFLFIVLVQEC